MSKDNTENGSPEGAKDNNPEGESNVNPENSVENKTTAPPNDTVDSDLSDDAVSRIKELSQENKYKRLKNKELKEEKQSLLQKVEDLQSKLEEKENRFLEMTDTLKKTNLDKTLNSQLEGLDSDIREDIKKLVLMDVKVEYDDAFNPKNDFSEVIESKLEKFSLTNKKKGAKWNVERPTTSQVNKSPNKPSDFLWEEIQKAKKRN